MLRHGGKHIFRQGKNNGNGLQLSHDEQRIGVGGMNHVADVNQAKTDTATNGCCNSGVGQLQLGIVDGGLIGLDCASELTY